MQATPLLRTEETILSPSVMSDCPVFVPREEVKLSHILTVSPFQTPWFCGNYIFVCPVLNEENKLPY
jgi:hypothetical protein